VLIAAQRPTLGSSEVYALQRGKAREVLLRQCENVTSSNWFHMPESLCYCLIRLVLYTYSVLRVFICGPSLFIRWSHFMNSISPFSGGFPHGTVCVPLQGCLVRSLKGNWIRLTTQPTFAITN